MGGEIGFGSNAKIAMGEVIWLQPLRLKLALGEVHGALQGEGVGGEGHACAELGLMLRDSGGDWLPRLCAIQCLR